jgi:photosystem II stability/assembly factor-like uncharacterized protein
MTLTQTTLNAQWINIYSNSNIGLIGVECINEDTVFVAGYNRTMLRTYDKGQTWQIIDVGFEIYALDINFPDAQTGYIVGASGRIAKTTDYGDNWELMITDTIYRLEKAEFIHPDTGWVIGTNMGLIDGIILKTINGGVSWDYFYPDENIKLLDIEMLNTLKGFIGIDSDISDPHGFLKTEDGGDTWNLSNPEFVRISTVSFLNEQIGYCTPQGDLYKTTDGGETWTFIVNDIGNHTVNRLQFLNEQTGYYAWWQVMWDEGGISRTDDGGNTWTDQISGKFWDIDMINSDTGYSVTGYGKIYKTINGGIPVGVTESNISQSKNVTVFPNPLTDRSELKINPDLLVDHCQLSFTLYDQKGRKVKQINNIKTSKIEITRENLSPGIYFYSLIGGNRIIESDKLLIK